VDAPGSPGGLVTEREEVVVTEIYHGVTIPLTDACYRLALGSLEATDYNLSMLRLRYGDSPC